MRLPNGYGSVRKLSGNRRRPWMVEKTEGWQFDQEGRRVLQKRITIGYYTTRKEALQALADYNSDPYDLSIKNLTFADLYQLWSTEKYKKTSSSNQKGYKAAYAICAQLYDVPMQDIKLMHLQKVVDTSDKNAPTLKKLKILFSQMFKYAVRHEVISKDKDVVKYLDISEAGNPNALTRNKFSDEEIETLWQKLPEMPYLAVTLMMIYAGTRTAELLNLKKADVHLEEQWFEVRHSKTNAGLRQVPIADKVLPLFRQFYERSTCEYLLCVPDGSRKLSYSTFKDMYFARLLEPLAMSHLPYDTRHTCVSLLAMHKVPPTIIKKIVGHKGAESLTERVYTHFDIPPLLEEINKI